MVDLPRLQTTVREAPRVATGLRPDERLVERGGEQIAAAQVQNAAASARIDLHSSPNLTQDFSNDHFLRLVKQQQAAIESTKALNIASQAQLELQTGIEELHNDQKLPPEELVGRATALYDSVAKKALGSASEVSEAAKNYVNQHLVSQRASALVATGREANKRIQANLMGAGQKRLDELSASFNAATTPEEGAAIAVRQSEVLDFLQGSGALTPQNRQRLERGLHVERGRSLYGRAAEKDAELAVQRLQEDKSYDAQEKNQILGDIYHTIQRQDFVTNRRLREQSKEEKKVQEASDLRYTKLLTEAESPEAIAEVYAAISQQAARDPESVSPSTLRMVAAAHARERDHRRALRERDETRAGKQREDAEEANYILRGYQQIEHGQMKTLKDIQEYSSGQDVRVTQALVNRLDEKQRREERGLDVFKNQDVRSSLKFFDAAVKDVPSWAKQLSQMQDGDINSAVIHAKNDFTNDVIQWQQENNRPIDRASLEALRTKHIDALREKLPSMSSMAKIASSKPVGDPKTELIAIGKIQDQANRDAATDMFLARRYALDLKAKLKREPTQEDIDKAFFSDPVMQKLIKDPDIRKVFHGQ